MNNIISWMYIGLSIVTGLLLIISTILSFVFDRITRYLSELRYSFLARAYPFD